MIKENNSQRYESWFSRIALILIFLFAFFLRAEDFSVWQNDKENFQYDGEYQMANFDSYYYLNITKELKKGNYEGSTKNRRIPNKMEAPFIPPLISVIAASVSAATGIPYPTVAIFIPVFLAPLLAFLVFIICIRLKFNKISALTAAFFSVISLTYVIRTRIGVFDTDCLNVTLILLNSYLFFRFAEIQNNKRYKYLALGLLNTLVAYAWWNTADSIVVLSAIIPLSVAIIFFFKTKKMLLKYLILGAIGLVSLYFIGDQIMAYFNLVIGHTQTTFPANMEITELNNVNVDYFIQQTTNNKFISLLMVIGLIGLIWKLRLKALFFIFPIFLAVTPFFAGNRFMIFSAPILALGIGYFIQYLFDLKKGIKPKMVSIIASSIVLIGLLSSLKVITDDYQKTAAYDNKVLLKALDKYTPKDANIWTDWDLGYQIEYYLNRGTYADGEFSDGEIYYYNTFPLAVDNLAVSANFMRFYNKHGIKGMKTLYEAFSDVQPAFIFLRNVLALKPAEAEQWLATQEKNKLLPKVGDLVSPKQWVSFLFPIESKDIYLLIYYKMTQTASFFKQGNSDLNTGKTIGLPLFLTFDFLQQQGSQIKNNQINLNIFSGVANYMGQQKNFQSLSTFDGEQTTTKTFSNPSLNNPDENFVFGWNQKIGFGAAMSKEMANTTLIKLYLLQEKSPYFEPVVINTPQYQIWKITGNAYEIK